MGREGLIPAVLETVPGAAADEWKGKTALFEAGQLGTAGLSLAEAPRFHEDEVSFRPDGAGPMLDSEKGHLMSLRIARAV